MKGASQLKKSEPGDVSELKSKIPIKEVLQILRQKVRESAMYEIPIYDEENVKRIYFTTAEDFIRFLTQEIHIFKVPAFKVVIPCGEIGANYYIVEGKTVNNENVIAFFRGMYGYGGSGPHQSALVEKFFELIHLKLETRCGDYLLGLLRIC
ncbi:MAG: hypothetical protein DRN30_05580 [Thermoplasmata archaeon]|nr:MAG: hypothetical protein DRN30_05580 [Thermoplasmata archaeon]